ncbi:TonB-dependent siderophore receptor [Pseudomonas sp. No.117]
MADGKNDSVQLAPTLINATQPETGDGPAPGYVAKRTLTGSKTDTPINEIPQAISVVTRDEMDQRGVQDFNAAVAYTPGIRALDYAGGQGAPDIFMRGFRSFNLFGIYQDGLRTGFNQYDTSFETFGLERVDVVKGPASVLYGQMAPGGIVNMTSKRPQDEAIRHIEYQTGSYDRQQFGIDLNSRLTGDGSLLGRIVMLQRDSGTQVDHSPNDRTYVAPSLTWRPTDEDTFTLLAAYDKSKTGGSEQSYPYIGTVKSSPFGHISSRTNLGWLGSYYRSETTSLGYLYEHDFANGWKFSQSARFMHSNVGYLSSGPDVVLNDDLQTQDIGLQYRPKSSNTLLTDQNLQGTFSTGSVQHTLLTGVDYSHYSGKESRLNGDPEDAFNNIDLYDPIYGGEAVWFDSLQRDTRSRMQQVGVYVQDQMRLDRWALTIGGRKDYARDYESDKISPYRYTQKDDKFTGRIGLAYLFDNGVTPYASYSTSFQPNPNTDVDGNLFKPTTGKQAEIGVKYEPKGYNASLTLAAYDLTQRNVTTADPNNPGFSIQTGEVRSRGLEVEGKAGLTENVNLIASYAYTDAEITKDTLYQGNTPRAIPRHTAAMWVDYTLRGGLLDGLGIGIGERYVGSSDNIQNTRKTPQYFLTDMTVRYDLARVGLKGAKFSVTAQNLFDKHYFEPGFYEDSVLYGNRRNVIATLGYDF